jgi:hypothetical protein
MSVKAARCAHVVSVNADPSHELDSPFFHTAKKASKKAFWERLLPIWRSIHCVSHLVIIDLFYIEACCRIQTVFIDACFDSRYL